MKTDRLLDIVGYYALGVAMGMPRSSAAWPYWAGGAGAIFVGHAIYAWIKLWRLAK